MTNANMPSMRYAAKKENCIPIRDRESSARMTVTACYRWQAGSADSYILIDDGNIKADRS